jgi:glucosamine-6-phosphate deaminase
MQIRVSSTSEQLADCCAAEAASILRDTLGNQDRAHVVAATGVSQFALLDRLAKMADLDWSRVTFFHLDEYVGIPAGHPASFRRFLKERVEERLHPGEFHYIDGSAPDPVGECRRLAALISPVRVDLLLAGIGQNGHLAFNEPPADLETSEPYIVVRLADASREQQRMEGWFESLDEVPTHAISMSVPQIMKARHILCLAPGRRKAEVVRDCLELEIDPQRPASILRRHPQAILFLDDAAASLLSDPQARGAC